LFYNKWLKKTFQKKRGSSRKAQLQQPSLFGA
jgi:hypothetical protein